MSESAGKALDLLFYLAKTDEEVSLARLSRDTGMNKATALRYLAVLESRGVAERPRRRMVPWPLPSMSSGTRVPVRSLVVERVRPYLERLARETGETANLACLAGGSAVYLDRAEANRSLRMRSAPGDRLPLYCTGVGKAILSILPEERARAILGSEPPPSHQRPHHHRPRGDPQGRDEGQGRGLWHGQGGVRTRPHLLCPAHLPRGERLSTGAISVSGPTARMRDPVIRDEMLDALRRSASSALAALKRPAGSRDVDLGLGRYAVRQAPDAE